MSELGIRCLNTVDWVNEIAKEVQAVISPDFNYKILKFMSRNEVRTLLADYGNKTGAEINNFVIRDLYSKIKENKPHAILNKIDEYLRRCAVEQLVNEVREYIDSDRLNITDQDIDNFVRERRNKINMRNAMNKGYIDFDGYCTKHAITGFTIRGSHNGSKYYVCSTCFAEGENKTKPNPERNIIVREFIETHGIFQSNLSNELGFPDNYISKYFRSKNSISDNHWNAISQLLLEVKENARQ